MQPLIKLIKPTVSEVILFLSTGFTLLVISNYGRFWDFLSNGVRLSDISENSTNIGLSLQNYFLNFEAKIDPRIADFTVWMVIGVISITIVMFLQHLIEDTSEEIEYTSKIRSEKFKARELSDYVLRALLRIAGFLLLVLFLRIFFGAMFNELSNAFFISVANLASIKSIITVVTTIIFSGVALYAIAICIRLMMLRTRVFG